MFGFLSMMGTYEDRKVCRDEFPWGFVSTCSVNDGEHPYETAVKHGEYCDGRGMVIVEAYDTREDAEAGHARWVSTMTAEVLPESLVDCQNSEVSRLLSAYAVTFPRRKV